MRDHVPNMRAALLARKLRAWLDGEGLWPSEVARRLGTSPSKISRLLSGKRGVRPADIGGLAALCHVTGADRADAVHLSEIGYDPTWVQTYRGQPPATPAMMLLGEETARRATVFHPLLVPDLVQLDHYTRTHLGTSPLIADTDMEARLDQLRARQSVVDPGRTSPIMNGVPTRDAQGGQEHLVRRPTRNVDGRSRPPTQFVFYIGESAMLSVPVRPEVMVAQLRYLLRLGASPSIDVRIVPMSAGLWWAGCSPFSLFEFEAQIPAVCLVNLTSVTVLEDKDTVRGYQRALEDLDTAALSIEKSRNLLIHHGQRWALNAATPDTETHPAI